MKYLKVLLVAVITVITFGSARAQVVVKARVGQPVHRHYYRHHRPIVHHRPYHRGYRNHYRRHYRHY